MSGTLKETGGSAQKSQGRSMQKAQERRRKSRGAFPRRDYMLTPDPNFRRILLIELSREQEDGVFIDYVKSNNRLSR